MDPFTEDFISMIATIPFDLVPLVVVLIFHRRNLGRIGGYSPEKKKVERYESVILSSGDYDHYRGSILDT